MTPRRFVWLRNTPKSTAGNFSSGAAHSAQASCWHPTFAATLTLPFYYNNRGSLTDADTFYDQYFRTGTTKRCNYSNPEFDKIIDEEQQIADTKKRVALLQRAGKILMEEVPFVPLYNLASIYGAAKNLAWKMRPDEKVLGWDMKVT